MSILSDIIMDFEDQPIEIKVVTREGAKKVLTPDVKIIPIMHKSRPYYLVVPVMYNVNFIYAPSSLKLWKSLLFEGQEVAGMSLSRATY